MPPATSLRFLAAAIVTLCCALASSQNASCSVQLSSSQPVVYPAIARAAHVSGTVTVLTRFNRDGSVASANVLNGPEMLRIATLTFLRTARTGVSEGSRECPILVAYQLVNEEFGNDCQALPNEEAERQSQSDPQHITVTALALGICDPAAQVERTQHRFLFFHWTTRAS